VTVRSSLVAVVAVVCAFLGGAGALVLGEATGWLRDGNGATETVVVRGSDGASPAVRIETGASEGGERLLPGDAFDPEEIYRERVDGVVTVYSLFEGPGEASPGAAQGSGFVVSRDGYILTNSHVITTAGEGPADSTPAPAERVFVEFRDADRVEAEIVGWDIFDDVGVLKVDPQDHALRPMPLGDSRDVRVGQWVAAIGSPFGQANTITAGIVAATERSIESLTSDYSLVDAIQTDAPINRGNSGGPLLDARGRVIGINAQIRSESGTAEGVGFAVPINSAIRSMDQLVETGEVRYAWIGITTQTVTPALAGRFGYGAERGAAVQSVIDGSPAEQAGLRGGTREREFAGLTVCPGGDLIVAIDGVAVASAEDVVRAVSSRVPGERARFTVVRGDDRRTVPVLLGERPSDAPDPGANRPCN
jgi:2-alkenal reductase